MVTAEELSTFASLAALDRPKLETLARAGRAVHYPAGQRLALCPSYHRGCYGCFGPMERPNIGALPPTLRINGMDTVDIDRVFSTVAVAAPAFADRSQDEPSQ
ncbi:hypothetical protein ACIRRA_15025 [Nocardia sp. NPDC101769]|uniref:hypothetical protein n=1 Tax=Nocardia sp. NPDC101769 TaxID=3364333 RepID=UPI0037F8F3B2